MKMGALFKRAREAGVTQEQLDDADDDDDPRGAVVELIASAPSAGATAGAPAPGAGGAAAGSSPGAVVFDLEAGVTVMAREKQVQGFRGSLEPPGSLPTRPHLYRAYGVF